MFRVYVAGTTSEALVSLAQSMNLKGTAIPAVGFGDWGVEPTIIVELGGLDLDGVTAFARAVCEAFAQEGVYIYDDGTRTGWVWFLEDG